MTNITKLTDNEVINKLDQIEQWKFDGSKLNREFVFSDFNEAFRFMALVALEAEKTDHHPEWSNIYNKVNVNLISHDVNGITDKDFALANTMNEIASILI